MKIDIKGVIVSNDDKWIYDWFEMDSVCPKDVNSLIENAKGENLDVFINSGGGDVFAGSEIYSSLRCYSGKVNIHIVGLAASAASVIACAGKSDISPTAMMMVHNVSGSANGDYREMDKSSEVLQKANAAIAAAYCNKTGMSEEEALELMDKETWLNAKDAVEKGLVDKIAESNNLKLVASFGDMLPQNVIDKIRNTVKGPSEQKAQSDLIFKQKNLDLLKLKGELKNV